MAHEFLDMLHKEHKEVQGILDELSKTSMTSTDRRQELFMTLRQNLIPHLTGEEKYFYPALEEKSESKMDALAAEEEHHAARMTLGELEKTSQQDEHWIPKLMVLKEMVDHHIKEEESKIFSDARRTLSEDRMRSIMQSYENEKSMAMKQM